MLTPPGRASGTATTPTSGASAPSDPPDADEFELRRATPALVAPFALVAVLGWALLLLPPYPTSWTVAVSAAAVLVLAAVAWCLGARHPHVRWLNPLAAYLMFPFAALVRHGSGSAESGHTALLMVPILWLALTGSRRQLYIAGALAVASFVVPPLVTSADWYPASDWRRAAMWALIAWVLAPVVQRLVQRLDRARRRARIEAARTELLFETAPHGVAVLDGAGRILRINAALGAIIGVDPQDMEGFELGDYAPPGDDSIAQHVAMITERGAAIAESDCVVRDSGGNDVVVACSSATVPDALVGNLIMVNVVDISERRRHQERLAHLAEHDVLTGLANRRRFDEELQRHLDFCRRHGPAGALLLLDLDEFKQVNDVLGHNAGDELIVSIGGLLRRSVRSTDVVARLGGDEFAVLLTEGDQAGAERVAANIVQRIVDFASTLDGVRRRVTASVGAVTFSAASEHAADILALADMTMYDAKDAGRNQYVVLPEGDARLPKASSRMRWERRIEEALEQGHFELHLQPILDVATDRVTSAEALLRLRDGDEIVPPSRFLYIAERAGLAPRVDAWVVGQSLDMLSKLQAYDPKFSLEVNLSGRSIGVPLVEEAIVNGLESHPVAPSSLILEITETAAVADVGLAREFAERMTALGCRFALDDFGAGFGSFYYLKHLIFDFLKIDGEFVAQAHNSPVDRTILRSIVGISRDLGKLTVAEFVSDPDVLDVVRSEGIDYAQGYHVGKPMPYDEFVSTHWSVTG